MSKAAEGWESKNWVLIPGLSDMELMETVVRVDTARRVDTLVHGKSQGSFSRCRLAVSIEWSSVLTFQSTNQKS